MQVSRWLGFLLCLLSLLSCLAQAEEGSWQAGFSRIEITPEGPIRLSGYAARSTEAKQVDDPLFIRTAVVQFGDSSPAVMVSVDAIGIPGSLTNRIALRTKERWDVGRPQLVISATHSHSAPHLDGWATNLFAGQLTEEENQRIREYTQRLEDSIVEAIELAMDCRQPITLEMGAGTARVSANRRVLQDGIWKGFGAQADGVVDHRIGILAAKDPAGKLKAVFYQFACHATTIPPAENRVSADWPGLSASQLEKQLDIIAFPIIGCGADINPQPAGSYAAAKENAAAIATAIRTSLDQHGMKPIVGELTTEFGYAGLPSEHPTREMLNQWSEQGTPHQKQYARNQIDLWNRRHVLPETYPAPIHVWSFGKQLCWVLLGGEVVLDYQIRLESELNYQNVWVASYCDDVFGYLASERMRAEGGYEVDESMIYYNLPGRWQTGTEDLVVRRVKEISHGSDRERLPLSPEESLRTIEVPEEFRLELVASEPLIQDPVNFAFDDRGRLWVVEMGDYPLGSPTGGRIKILTDQDADGRMDQATVFLDRLSYPNSVYPFRDGALVACAPDVFFAADRDGDGYAEYRETWIAGFPEANPQHRMNGFTYGLDGRLYMSSGEDASHIQVPGSDEKLRASGRDLAIDLSSKQIEFVAGPTQFIRGRDDWNRWFGNANNEPMYQFVIEDHQQQRARRSVDTIRQFLTTPAVGPEVFPLSSADSRFNDVFSANRFTSACSSVICRTDGCGQEMIGAAMICEPVHNLVHRIKLIDDGPAYRGERFPQDQKSEWIRSSDPWFRPVRIDTGPDGSVWIADMYRLVIEHPQWIPEEWQARMDLRAGQDRGRIYRIRHRDHPPAALPKVNVMNDQQVIIALQSPVGPLRDQAQQRLIEQRPTHLRQSLEQLVRHHADPRIRLQCLATLNGCGWLDPPMQLELIKHEEHPRVLQFLLDLLRRRESLEPTIIDELCHLPTNRIDDELAMHLILLLGQIDEPTISKSVAQWVEFRIQDPWIQRSLALIRPVHQREVIRLLGDRLSRPESFTSQEDAKVARSSSVVRAVGRLMVQSQEPLVDENQIAKWVEQSSRSELTRFAMTPIVAAWLQTVPATRAKDLPSQLLAWLEQAQAIVGRDEAPLESRASAVHLLGWGREPAIRNQAWLDCLASHYPLEVQQVAFERLLSSSDEEALARILERWNRLGPSLRLTITNSLMRQPKWIIRLLKAIDEGQVRASDIDASSVQSMLNTWNRDVQTRAVRIFGQSTVRDRTKLVEQYLAAISKPGLVDDLDVGKRLYQQHCAICHESKDDSPALGPNLTSLTDRSTRNLVTGILDPNRAVDGRYKQYLVLTDDDMALAGVVVQESASSVTLGSADGKHHEIPRSTIVEMKDQGISLMPEGLERQIPAESLHQIVRFIQEKTR